MRTNLLYILFFIGLLVNFGLYGQEKESEKIDFSYLIKNKADSITQQVKYAIGDTIVQQQKTKKRETLTDVVDAFAKDYKKLSRKNNTMELYNEAVVEYGDMTINAGRILLNNSTREVFAAGIIDSAGTYTQSPTFKQGNNIVEPDSLIFNFDSQKALVFNSRTEQGGFKVKGEISKRQNDSIYYLANAKFTTAEDVDDADYYFFARKIKFVPDSKIVTGLVNMYIADVPTPLGLPFGYFPLTDKQASGFIIPAYGENRNRGFFLMNGGYYFAISDNVDLAVQGDYYTNGSYGLRMESNYNVRYRFNGNAAIRYEKLLLEERGFPNFSETTVFNIRWSHNQDQKANPSSRFSASVNLGSSDYYQQSVNQNNTGNFLNNTLNSSVSYSKTFDVEPAMNLNISATHNQNTNTQVINMTLPTLQFSIGRVFPFEPKTGAKKGAIENINLQYNLRAENRISTTDSLFFRPEMFESADVGARHTIPISTNFKIFNHFSVSTSANFNEVWTLRTFDQRFDEQLRQVERDTVNGFDSYRTYDFSTSVGTTVYGMFDFGDNKKIKAIRHVVRPSVSYNISPAFDQYYDEYTRTGIAGLEDEVVEFSRFEGTLNGAPGNNFASSMSFNVTNDIEAKVRKKDSTLTGEDRFEKRSLLSNFGLSTNYNFAVDSLNLSPISVRGTLPIVKDKLAINFLGTLDMYALNSNNRRINTLNINNGGSLFRLTRGNASFSYSFSNKDFQKKDDDEDEEDEDEEFDSESFRNGGRPDDLFGTSEMMNRPDPNKDPVSDENDRYNYAIPWNLNLSYTMTYANATRENEISSHSIMFSGDVELSPTWKVGVSSGYDIRNKGFSFTQLRFAKDLKSWQMSFNWTPFGVRRSWFFFIGIKSNILQDVKYDKNRERDRTLQ
ncbi:putative LPS assembly protein LptD [Psychroflexus montanilacus]|uniref:putative LPS assembly protein LptD n=1 Tax=Psychroflexus montanilacus TaxID=2873598 RepID=UPI001CD01A0A|nr:putative LPS assembly protein LptD [Psychroflexus montanilacus]MBZ9650402.1 LPS-assembly protein LptD [Psychroflexus montanilacus]